MRPTSCNRPAARTSETSAAREQPSASAPVAASSATRVECPWRKSSLRSVNSPKARATDITPAGQSVRPAAAPHPGPSPTHRVRAPRAAAPRAAPQRRRQPAGQYPRPRRRLSAPIAEFGSRPWATATKSCTTRTIRSGREISSPATRGTLSVPAQTRPRDARRFIFEGLIEQDPCVAMVGSQRLSLRAVIRVAGRVVRRRGSLPRGWRRRSWRRCVRRACRRSWAR